MGAIAKLSVRRYNFFQPEGWDPHKESANKCEGSPEKNISATQSYVYFSILSVIFLLNLLDNSTSLQC